MKRFNFLAVIDSFAMFFAKRKKASEEREKSIILHRISEKKIKPLK